MLNSVILHLKLHLAEEKEDGIAATYHSTHQQAVILYFPSDSYSPALHSSRSYRSDTELQSSDVWNLSCKIHNIKSSSLREAEWQLSLLWSHFYNLSCFHFPAAFYSKQCRRHELIIATYIQSASYKNEFLKFALQCKYMPTLGMDFQRMKYLEPFRKRALSAFTTARWPHMRVSGQGCSLMKFAFPLIHFRASNLRLKTPLESRAAFGNLLKFPILGSIK